MCVCVGGGGGGGVENELSKLSTCIQGWIQEQNKQTMHGTAKCFSTFVYLECSFLESAPEPRWEEGDDIDGSLKLKDHL